MIKLAETIKGQSWSTFDWNSIDSDGCVVDLGCLAWDWSGYWIGLKRVIGVDPIEEKCPIGCEFFRGVIGPCDKMVSMLRPNGDDISAIVNNDDVLDKNVEMISWKSFCERFKIDRVSILKINIEGSEYSFLESLDDSDFSKINQIVVSFHDWLNGDFSNLTKSSIKLLEEKGFVGISTYFPFGWYLFVKKEFIYKECNGRMIW